MSKKIEFVTADAIRVTSHYSAFEGDVEKWKEAFYTIWRYQLTWSFAYEISLQENRKSGVFVSILLSPNYHEELLATMEDLGYREIHSEHVKIGVIDAYQNDIDTNIDTMTLEW